MAADHGGSGLVHHASDDLADALEQAVSTLQDDDLLAAGQDRELTLDHIHNLTSEACRLPAAVGNACKKQTLAPSCKVSVPRCPLTSHPALHTCDAASSQPVRSASYHSFEGSDLGSVSMYSTAHAMPAVTHIGDVIPIQRPASTGSSMGDARRLSTAGDDEAEST